MNLNLESTEDEEREKCVSFNRPAAGVVRSLTVVGCKDRAKSHPPA